MWILFDGVASECADCYSNVSFVYVHTLVVLLISSIARATERRLSNRLQDSLARSTGSSSDLTLDANIVIEDLSVEQVGEEQQAEAGAFEGVESIDCGQNLDEASVPNNAHCTMAGVGMTEIPVHKRSRSLPTPRSPNIAPQNLLTPDYRLRLPSLVTSVTGMPFTSLPDNKLNGAITSDSITSSGQNNPEVSYQPAPSPGSRFQSWTRTCYRTQRGRCD